jgi:MoaA/NifB/PqqE/SkfB family radical SAM enzyme
MRDMPVLIDGTAPLCREQIGGLNDGINLGNAFTEPLEVIWEKGRRFYTEQAGQTTGGNKYDSLCAGCDEYYTYNF